MAEDSYTKLMRSAECEVCKKESATENINIGLDIGYHFGNYANKDPIEYIIKPKCVAVCSIYLCRDCKDKLRRMRFYRADVLDRLRELIKGNWLKNKILEELEK